jgi:hypothetical protein
VKWVKLKGFSKEFFLLFIVLFCFVCVGGIEKNPGKNVVHSEQSFSVVLRFSCLFFVFFGAV